MKRKQATVPVRPLQPHRCSLCPNPAWFAVLARVLTWLGFAQENLTSQSPCQLCPIMSPFFPLSKEESSVTRGLRLGAWGLGLVSWFSQTCFPRLAASSSLNTIYVGSQRDVDFEALLAQRLRMGPRHSPEEAGHAPPVRLEQSVLEGWRDLARRHDEGARCLAS